MFKFKFKNYVFSILLVLGSVLIGDRAEAACTASVTPLNFGDINPVSPGILDFDASLTYTCSGLVNLLSNVYVCIEIGPGSGDTSINPRTLTHSSIPTEKLTFNIYKDAGRQNIWGYQYTADETPMVIDKGVIVLGLGTVITETLPIYGRVFSSNPFMLRNIGRYSSSMDVTVKMSLIGIVGLTSCIDVLLTGDTVLNATATLISACTVSANPLNFGSHPSNFASSVQSTSTINTACSKGSIYQIGLNNGQNADGGTRRMKATDGSYIVYELYNNSSYTQRWGETLGTSEVVQGTATGLNQQATVYGQVEPQTGLNADTYTDTITASVTY